MQAIDEALDSLPDYGEIEQRAAAVRSAPDRQLELLPGELEHFQQVRVPMHSLPTSIKGACALSTSKALAVGMHVLGKTFNQWGFMETGRGKYRRQVLACSLTGHN